MEVYVGTQVSEDVHFKLRMIALRKRMSLRKLVREILESYVREHDPELTIEVS